MQSRTLARLLMPLITVFIGLCATPAIAQSGDEQISMDDSKTTVSLSDPAQKPTDAEKAEQARVDRITLGIQDVKSGERDKAVALMDQNLVEYDAVFPDKADIYCTDGTAGDALIALTLIKAADKQAGKKRSVTAVGPGWCQSMWLKAFILTDLKQYELARKLLETATEHAPTNPRYQYELGFLIGKMGDPQRSYDYYKNVEAIARLKGKGGDFWRAKALYGQGYALIDLNRLDEAEATFNALLKLDPNYEKAKHELKYIAELRKRQ